MICKICKKENAIYDYGLCKKCDLWLIENREEVYKIKYEGRWD